jgi:hypothetical protein
MYAVRLPGYISHLRRLGFGRPRPHFQLHQAPDSTCSGVFISSPYFVTRRHAKFEFSELDFYFRIKKRYRERCRGKEKQGGNNDELGYWMERLMVSSGTVDVSHAHVFSRAVGNQVKLSGEISPCNLVEITLYEMCIVRTNNDQKCSWQHIGFEVLPSRLLSMGISTPYGRRSETLFPRHLISSKMTQRSRGQTV